MEQGRGIASRLSGAKGPDVISRLISAGARAFLVALLIALPSALLPGIADESLQVVSLVAFVAAGLTFVEYFASYPSIIEFRDAPPFNRVRFIMIGLTVLILTLALRDGYTPGPISGGFAALASLCGQTLDFPYSPVRMVVLTLPEDAPRATVAALRDGAGIAFAGGLVALIFFFANVVLRDWPYRLRTFNVWVNLPLFDPTSGGDVLKRLRRDSNVNISLGVLLPFLTPAMVRMASDAFDPLVLAEPHTLIWTMTAWAFLPVSLIMRGIALGRVADMIAAKRRRAYAKSQRQEAEQPTATVKPEHKKDRLRPQAA